MVIAQEHIAEIEMRRRHARIELQRSTEALGRLLETPLDAIGLAEIVPQLNRVGLEFQPRLEVPNRLGHLPQTHQRKAKLL